LRHRLLPALTLAAVCFGVGSALYAAWDQGWTYDEPYHFGWSRRLLEEGVTERQSTPLFNSKTPILVPNVLAKMAGEAAGIRDATALRFLSRLPTVGWFATTLLVLFLAVRRRVGTTAAHLATVATALDPNWIAHGSLATPDAIYALATLLCLVAGLRFGERPTWRSAAILGVTLGLAFLAKFTAFLLIPGLLVLPLALGSSRRQVVGMLRLAVVTALVAWFLISAGYLFKRLGEPLSAFEWKSAPLARAAELLPWLPVPVPGDFLTGVDMCVAHERGKGWPVMILGHHYPDGVFFYFVVLWLLKTPLLLLLAEVFGLCRALGSAPARANPALRLFGLNVLIAGFYFSFLFRAQIGYRYVLMCLPLAYAIAAAGLATLPRRRRWTGLGLAVVAVSMAENALYLGNPLAFTNAAVWPKKDVYRLMDNSNLSWGQNRMKIQGWLEERGLGDAHLDPVHILPGDDVFEVGFITGVDSADRERWVRENLRPEAQIGHTHLLYRVSPSQYARFLDEARRLPSSARDQALCSGASEASPLNDANPPRFGDKDHTAVWIACLRADSLADVGLSTQNGLVSWGPATLPRWEWERIAPGQIAWYRLEPGWHAFGATGADWRFRGTWHVSGGPVVGAVDEGRLDDQERLGLLEHHRRAVGE
jgi:4-amino-4-deoxy-L-arabinose transferase-like glycosyltransferase